MPRFEGASGWPGAQSALDRVWRALSVLFTAGVELQERLLLINRPWEEELLHWGEDARLHGAIAPPPGQHSTTSTGWCLGTHRRVQF
ncbi:hypothetical protein [Flexivirga alba]|uniref:Uncharacterized protein n=1 Tax=Flexivirga alba TaxID=702742 RepID=A0ABW2ADD2_9MICO